MKFSTDQNNCVPLAPEDETFETGAMADASSEPAKVDNCKQCGKKLSWGNRSGLCRTHFNADPDWQAKRAAGIRMAYKSRPELREKQSNWIASLNRTEEARARSGRMASEIKLWEIGLPKLDAEARARGGKTLTDRALAHIPPDYRELYFDLTKRKRLKADEAARLVEEHAAADLERFRRGLGV